MSRSEIVELLNSWIREGRLVSKTGLGLPYAEINRRIAAGEWLLTSCESVLCADSEVRELFEQLWAEKRVMDRHACMVNKNLLTIYAMDKACNNGEFVRVDLEGKKTILYVD